MEETAARLHASAGGRRFSGGAAAAGSGERWETPKQGVRKPRQRGTASGPHMSLKFTITLYSV
jgi:hypothetical protein